MIRHRWPYAGGLAAFGLCLGIVVAVRCLDRPSAPAEPDAAPPPARPAEEPPPELTLPAAEREFLWQIEHHGNLLNRYGFGALADALRRGDADALAALLAADFAGQA